MSSIVADPKHTLGASLESLATLTNSISGDVSSIQTSLETDVINTVMGPVADRYEYYMHQRNTLTRDLLNPGEPNHFMERVKHEARRTIFTGDTRDLEQVVLQVAYWADKAARLEMATQFGKEISTTLDDRVAAIQDQVKAVKSEIANASRIWDNAQTGIASGRVAYAKRREDIIREMIAGEKKMNALMEQINKVEAAQTRATSSNTSKYTDDGRILMSEQESRDFTSVSKMLAENLRTLKKQAGISLHSTKDRDPKNTLKVPTQLEEMCRGEELRMYMQAFLDDNRELYPVTSIYLRRTNGDMDPSDSSFYKPPSMEDKFAEVPTHMREKYTQEALTLWNVFVQVLPAEMIGRYKRGVVYGRNNAKTIKVLPGDGPSMYWAALTVCRPVNAEHKEKVEDWLDAAHMGVTAKGSQFVQHAEKIRKYIDEAKLLGIRVKWHKTGARWIEKLVANGCSDYGIELSRYREAEIDTDDCIMVLSEIILKIQTIAVRTVSESVKNGTPFYKGPGAMAMGINPEYPQDVAAAYMEGEDIEHLEQGMAGHTLGASGPIRHNRFDRRQGDRVREPRSDFRQFPGYRPGPQHGLFPPHRGKGGNRLEGENIVFQGAVDMKRRIEGGGAGEHGYSRSGMGGRNAHPAQFKRGRANLSFAEDEWAALDETAHAVMPRTAMNVWNPRDGCFADGCKEQRFMGRDEKSPVPLCKDCHHKGMMSGTVKTRDGRSYHISKGEKGNRDPTAQWREQFRKLLQADEEYRLKSQKANAAYHLRSPEDMQANAAEIFDMLEQMAADRSMESKVDQAIAYGAELQMDCVKKQRIYEQSCEEDAYNMWNDQEAGNNQYAALAGRMNEAYGEGSR